MANEINRMESIVADIEKLRSSYTQCIQELESKNMNAVLLKSELDNSTKVELEKTVKLVQKYKVLLEKEKKKNASLNLKVVNLSKSSVSLNDKPKSNDKSNKINKNILESKLKEEKLKNTSLLNDLKLKYEKIIINKDKTILSLENRINNDKKSIVVKKEICEDNNPFPSLMMKENIQESNVKVEVPQNKIDTKELVVNSRASTFRLNKESKIYDKIDGNILFSWEDRTSFTTTKTTENWINITGYFIDKKWIKAKESLWVKKVNATAR
ncbi:hypothetical protein N9X61_01910 [Sulfurimonas sp.]|nr:hypothetical protein [Sulfurimonas sp.]